MPRIERRLDLADHLLRRDQRLVVEVAAALRERLILDLDRIRAGALEQAHRARHVERIAVAGIRIDDEMAADAIADQGNRIGHLAHRNEADVGATEPGIGNAGPRDIDRGEPCPLGKMRGQRIVDAGRDEDRRGGKTGA